MKIPRRIGIRGKMVALLLLATSVALAVGFTVLVLHDLEDFKRDTKEGAVAITRVIANYSVVDLAFEDRTASAVTLSKLAAIPEVQCAFLYDAKGVLFSTYRKEQCQATPPPRPEPMAEFEGPRLHVVQIVAEQSRIYGVIQLYISTQGLSDKIKRYLFTIFGLAAGLIALSFLLAVFLQNIVTKPLRELAQATRSISEKQDYSIRVRKSSSDEIGALCDEFNGMLAQLERRESERIRVEEALRESEDRYRLLVESSPQGVFLEQEQRIIFVNSAGLRLTGCASIDDLHQRTLASLFTELAREASGGVTVETGLIRSDGKTIGVEATFISTVYQGRVANQALVRDITESRNLRQAAERMHRLASLGEFSAMLAHEIRNALASISLNVRTLGERLEIPESSARTFNNLQAAIERIQDLIKSMLDFARPAPPALRKVKIQKVLESSVLMVENDLRRAGIEVGYSFDGATPDLLLDPNQCSHVFVNLLLNAKQAMAAGGRITIGIKNLGSVVEVKIADTGKGIPQNNLERIFDPFFTTNPGGVGLGLAVVARILEQHEAQVLVDSKVGEGTVFTVLFPVERGT